MGVERRFVYRFTWPVSRACRPHRFRQDHDHEFVDAILRRAEGTHSARRRRRARLGLTVAAREFRRRITGHLFVHRHRREQHSPRAHGYFRRTRPLGRNGSARRQFHSPLAARIQIGSARARCGVVGRTETIDLFRAGAGFRSGAFDSRRSDQLDRHRD